MQEKNHAQKGHSTCPYAVTRKGSRKIWTHILSFHRSFSHWDRLSSPATTGMIILTTQVFSGGQEDSITHVCGCLMAKSPGSWLLVKDNNALCGSKGKAADGCTGNTFQKEMRRFGKSRTRMVKEQYAKPRKAFPSAWPSLCCTRKCAYTRTNAYS